MKILLEHEYLIKNFNTIIIERKAFDKKYLLKFKKSANNVFNILINLERFV